MVGGLATSFIMELLVYPAIFLLWRSRQLKPVTTFDPATVVEQQNA
jgi:Cu(I)/Ag(I) efflux system membrane protein CusA/SilA